LGEEEEEEEEEELIPAATVSRVSGTLSHTPNGSP